MAFKLNSNIVLSNDGINIPVFAGNARPANPVTGQVIYNSSTNIMEIYDGGLWKDVTQNASGTAFLYRQLISTSYVAGGYQSASPWKNVNRMSQSTDIMTNLGDLLSIAANYTSGANSLTTAYMWCASPTWDGTAVATVAYNMATETSAGSLSSWNMPVARNDCGTIFKETQYAYVTGGSSADVSVWTFSTESFSSGAVSGQTGDSSYQYGVASISDETSGYWWGSSGQKLTFGTGTTYTIANAANVNVNGQQKGISSKLGFGYFGNEGGYNGGYNLRKYITSTDTYTTIPKPIGNSGEENFDMGQYWQYMMGMYDGAQNNRGWKFSYTADTGYELGSGSTRTGVPGGSSGHCAWKA
jgi:hypothetical protein